jgi:hypothetical protein
MVAWNLGPTWTDRTRRHARYSTRPIHGTLVEQREKSYLITTAMGERVWLPKRGVSHDPVKGIFMVPSWLAEKKLLSG